MFNNLRISNKLYLGFGVVILMGLVLFIFNYSNFKTIGDSTVNTKDVQYPLLKEANDMTILSIQLQKWFIDIASERNMGAYAEGLVESTNKLSEFNLRLDSLIAIDPENEARLEKLREPFAKYFEIGLSMTQAYALNNAELGAVKKEEFDKYSKNIQASLNDYYNLIEVGFYSSLEDIDKNTTSAITMGVIISLLSIILSIVIAYYIARIVSRPINEITKITVAVSKGDLEQHININSKDEIGILGNAVRDLIHYMRDIAEAAKAIAANDLTVEVTPKSEEDVLGHAFKTMTTNLTSMIQQLNQNSSELVNAVNMISTSSNEMSKGAEQQTQQVNSVSASIEEMAATILQSSQNATEATKASQNASDTAVDGGKIVSETMNGMEKITKVVRESAESIARLATSADQIGEIISVIDDIADQTNLLALNAAIEAARAGEQGRGFAVVADEVRKLAERTGKATSEISGMIKGIQTETDEAVNSMEMGVQEVDKGKQLSDNAGTSLNEIVEMSQQVSNMVEQIAVASDQQSKAAEEISRNVEEILIVTKKTEEGASNSAQAALELNQQAESLQGIVDQFKL